MTGTVTFPLERDHLEFDGSGGSRITRTVLPSGVRIVSEQVPGARSATIGFWVAVGSRDEYGPGAVPSGFGSTHFLEHLLFKGTPTRSALDIAVAFDSVGGDSNAVTSKEYTCYYAKVRDQDVPMAIGVLSDMLTSSVIDGTEFETERGVILEELRHAADDPADVAGEELYSAVFGEHPLGRPVGGTAATIVEASRSGVWEHYRRHYRPQDLVITVAGSVDHDGLVSSVSTALESAGWDLSSSARPAERRSEGPATLPGRSSVTTIDRPVEQVHLMVGTPGLVATDRSRVTLSVLNAILGGGMSSRLFTEVREKRGLAYAVQSFSSAHSDAGIHAMYAACAPRNASAVLELMEDQLARIAREGITDEELQRAYGQLSGRASLGMEDSDVRMSLLGQAEITLGEYADLDETLRRIRAVTADDVAGMADKLSTGPRSVVAVGGVGDLDIDGSTGGE